MLLLLLLLLLLPLLLLIDTQCFCYAMLRSPLLPSSLRSAPRLLLLLPPLGAAATHLRCVSS
jgi:hypothetical protein